MVTRYFVPAAYLVASLVNLTPIVGVISDMQLLALYDIEQPAQDVALLMRYRAILFGIVGGLILAAVFKQEWRMLAAVAGLTSMLSFVALVFVLDHSSATLTRLAWIDIGASMILASGYLASAKRVGTNSSTGRLS